VKKGFGRVEEMGNAGYCCIDIPVTPTLQRGLAMVYFTETSYLKWLFFPPGSTFHVWALCQFTKKSVDNDCAVVFLGRS